MNLRKSIFLAGALLLLIFTLRTWPSLSAESSSSVQALFSSILFPSSNTPAQCPEIFVDPTTEGPYYKKGSPERTNLVEEGTVGDPITLTGYVFDKNCNPVPNAWLDFWQTDGSGNYDNRGYKLRGHQYTDKDGKYLLRTVIPRPYPGRTSHIHVKVAKQAGKDIITSQLYFPGRSQNARDPIFSASMVIKLDKNEEGKNLGYFNFRLNQ
jgi:protocatechuate 3,4-dioxygenase beta subunit